MNFDRMASNLDSKAQRVTDALMPMGSELPGFIAHLNMMGRFLAVGSLWQTGTIPHKDIAIALLFQPENVRFASSESYEETTAMLDTMESADATVRDYTMESADFVTDTNGTTDTTALGAVTHEPDDTVTDDAGYTQLDYEIYSIAENLASKYPEDMDMVVRAVTAVGLDWPKGSGDYHGHRSFEQMSDRDRILAVVEVYRIVDRMAERHGVSVGDV